MKNLKKYLYEAEESTTDAVIPKSNEKDDKPNTSLLKYSIDPKKKFGAMIYDKILNVVQVVQYDSSKDLEMYYDVNPGSMKYIDGMTPGESNEDENSIITVIWADK